MSTIIATLQRVFAHTSVLVGAGIASLVAFTQGALSLPISVGAVGALFVCSVFIYALDHALDARVQPTDDKNAHAAAHSRHMLGWVLLFAGASIAALVLAPPPARVALLAYLSAGIIYGLPLFPGIRRTNDGPVAHLYRLKDIPGFKAWYVGLVVAGIAIWLPLAWTGTAMSVGAWFVAGFHFVFFATNVHVFDIRDVDNDRAHGVRTLPVTLGVAGTRRLLALINLMWLALVVAAWTLDLGGAHGPMAIATLVSLGYLATTNANTPAWVYGLVIDGLVLSPAAALLLVG